MTNETKIEYLNRKLDISMIEEDIGKVATYKYLLGITYLEYDYFDIEKAKENLYFSMKFGYKKSNYYLAKIESKEDHFLILNFFSPEIVKESGNFYKTYFSENKSVIYNYIILPIIKFSLLFYVIILSYYFISAKIENPDTTFEETINIMSVEMEKDSLSRKQRKRSIEMEENLKDNPRVNHDPYKIIMDYTNGVI